MKHYDFRLLLVALAAVTVLATPATAGPIDIFEFSMYVNSSETGAPSLRDTVLGLGPDTLSAGLDVTFTNGLDSDNVGTMTWSLTNNTGGNLTNVSLFGFLDAEIDETINTFFNEFGTTSDLVLGGGAGDGLADSFEIDEPGFVFGDIIGNLLAGSLDNTNALQPALSDDVSMALGFDIGTLLAGQTATATFNVSLTNNNGLGHVDPNSNFQFWYNGNVVLSIPDADEDGIPDDDDLCPDTATGDTVDTSGCSDAQVDGDGDGFCDPGAASEGPSMCMLSPPDNCPDDANPGQEDLDMDGLGDVCDPDADGDGVADANEPAACLNTAIPEESVPSAERKKNRYVLTGPTNGDTVLTFDSDNKTEFTTADTGGCSCEQIIDALGLGGGHVLFGCSKSAMQQWIDQL